MEKKGERVEAQKKKELNVILGEVSQIRLERMFIGGFKKREM